MELDVYADPNAAEADPEVYIALLDDEYFSYPEVAPVWDDLNCTDVRKAAKRSLRIDWKRATTKGGDHQETLINEKIRPRWWYIAIGSCSKQTFQLSYRAHLVNQRRGWQSEFSLDEVGVYSASLAFSVCFLGLAAAQFASLSAWRVRSRTGRWGSLHPALLLITAAAGLAAAGQASWLSYYRHYRQSGQPDELLELLARACIIGAKTLMSLVLLLLAQGECVCVPDISWSQHRELIGGLAVFAVLSFCLEHWGDGETNSTTTEYVYDTRPGMVLVAFDVFFFWLYVSRTWSTFQAETRVKARRFFRGYGLLFASWFAALPLVAAIARALAPWVRSYITIVISGVAHAIVLAALVHLFRPSVAPLFFEIRTAEYEKVNLEEMDDISWDDDTI